MGNNLSGYFISNLVLVTSCDTTRGVHLPLVSICALVSIYSYKLTVSNGGGVSFGFGIYMVSIKSYKLTVLNGGGGSFGLGISMVSIKSYKLTVLNRVSLMT